MSVAGSTRLGAAEFARAVRAALSDLPADEIEELTDGLESDLAERLAELGDELPDDPAAYAAELRAAAGLPAVSVAPHRPLAERLGMGVGVAIAVSGRRLRAHRGTAWCLDLLNVLRPVGWLVRGWVAFQLIVIVCTGGTAGFIPIATGPGSWLVETILLLALVLLSVQWGRGRWRPWRWLRIVQAIASVVAVILVVPLAFASVDAVASSEYGPAEGPSIQPGLSIDGRQIDNIFAYDSAGDLIPNVRLFDQAGHPIRTTLQPGASGTTVYTANGTGYELVRSRLADGVAGWDVYPLQRSHGRSVRVPYQQVQPLTSTPAPTANATPGPTATATPSPGPTATPSATAIPAP